MCDERGRKGGRVEDNERNDDNDKTSEQLRTFQQFLHPWVQVAEVQGV
jgi:hypothetical protein